MAIGSEKIKVAVGQSVWTVEVWAAANNHGVLGQNEKTDISTTE